MSLFLLALGVLLAGGMAAVVLTRRPAWSVACAVGSAVLGCLLGLIFAFRVLFDGVPIFFRAHWDVPYGEFALSLDPLSAFFAMIIFSLPLLAFVYGGEYLRPYRNRKALGWHYAWFHCLIAAMALTVAARNAMLFLMAWEVMSLASFFLVTFEDDKEEVCAAGWTYLIATHVGTAFLLIFFALCYRQTGSLDFDQWGRLGLLAPGPAGVLFGLALVGFGTKAGFVPLHVWLPQAHPAAPSHVSAVMSGVMIKMGIYGILRVLTLLGPPPPWWGITLLCIGLVSGVLGILFALAQEDLKRLLAFSSIENIGIIAVGIGVGLLGKSCGSSLISLLGFGGALLHVLNHALFKGLLFLGAGAVAHATGTRQMESLGGLFKRMPGTAASFLLGSAAICALPPLNGFVSEWLIYAGCFQCVWDIPTRAAIFPLAAIAVLALIGGLAAACFAKVFGTVFLGAPRNGLAQNAHEAARAMTVPMGILALCCCAIGVWPVAAFGLVAPVAGFLTGGDFGAANVALQGMYAFCRYVSLVAAVFLGIVVFLAMLRRALLARQEIRKALTWDCGYALPTSRMQYSASSFARPLTGLFRTALKTRIEEDRPLGYFPASASRFSRTPDVVMEYGFRPLLRWVQRTVEHLRWLQQGRVQLYLLYIFIALVALLVWKFGM